jgi:hypothetical protein
MLKSKVGINLRHLEIKYFLKYTQKCSNIQ